MSFCRLCDVVPKFALSRRYANPIYGSRYCEQLLNNCWMRWLTVERDIMNYQNRGLCYLPKQKAEADNTDTRF